MAEPASQHEARQRVERIQAFRAELGQLESEGLIRLSEDQRRTLEQHHDETLARLQKLFDVDTSEAQRRFSWGMRAASALGGVALCAAIVLFFYRIWGIVPIPLQIALLVLTPALAVVATALTARQEKSLYYTSLLALVAIAAFILNLTVLAGILNLTESPHAILAWGIFALAIAYAHGLRLPLIIALVCLLDYSAILTTFTTRWYWVAHLQRPEHFLPGALLLMGIPAVLGRRGSEMFAAHYRSIAAFALFLVFLILSLNGHLSYIPWQEHTVRVFYQVVGILGFSAIVALGVRCRWQECVYLGSLFFAALTYVRLFDWWWNWLPKYLFFLVIGLISLALLALFRKIRAGTFEGAVS